MLKRNQFSLKSLVIALALAAVVCGLVFTLPRLLIEASQVRRSRNNMEWLAKAMRVYRSEKNRLFEAQIDKAYYGYPHSWRLDLCSHLSPIDYRSGYDFEKPWDAPENIDLALELLSGRHCTVRVWGLPGEYRSPQKAYDPNDFETDVVLFVGEGTAFPPDRIFDPDEFPDGAENTLLAIELIDSGIHWLEPRDLRYPEDIFEPSRDTLLKRIRAKNYTSHVIFADFKVFALNPDLDSNQLEALITTSGGESISRQQLVEQGLLY